MGAPRPYDCTRDVPRRARLGSPSFRIGNRLQGQSAISPRRDWDRSREGGVLSELRDKKGIAIVEREMPIWRKGRELGGWRESGQKRRGEERGKEKKKEEKRVRHPARNTQTKQSKIKKDY